ncbi:hypothetical protein FALBO_14120 [Fusarium albosuccineum]|uniref:Uncharacterized protein n=1 Tax=Fusarium albosuccineum TaxID=1237068 RepID=A0A8H4KXJ0_9HYPO|nr:hypothetical protein FALBO_14120 [Fusarium albosuccineum]
MDSHSKDPRAITEKAFEGLGKIGFGLALLAREASSKDIEHTSSAVANAAIRIKEIQHSLWPVAEEARNQRLAAKASLWGDIKSSYPTWRLDRDVVDEFIERYKAQEMAKDPSLCNANWVVTAPRDFYPREGDRELDDPLFETRPRAQFQSQFARECERLVHQKAGQRYGRKQTLPWAESMDLYANAENNVRKRWVQQGIWGKDWGPAWCPGSRPMAEITPGKGRGPYLGLCGQGELDGELNGELTGIGTRWGHEKWTHWARRRNDSSQVRAQSRFVVRRPQASRPYRQFLYQVRLERKWIKDELDFRHPGHKRDLETLAYESAKCNWEDDGIWREGWDVMPGHIWQHEAFNPLEASSDGDSSSDEGSDATQQSKRGTKSPLCRANYKSKIFRDDVSLGEEGLAIQSENTRESSIADWSASSELSEHSKRLQLKRKPKQGAGKKEMATSKRQKSTADSSVDSKPLRRSTRKR